MGGYQYSQTTAGAYRNPQLIAGSGYKPPVANSQYGWGDYAGAGVGVLNTLAQKYVAGKQNPPNSKWGIIDQWKDIIAQKKKLGRDRENYKRDYRVARELAVQNEYARGMGDSSIMTEDLDAAHRDYRDQLKDFRAQNKSLARKRMLAAYAYAHREGEGGKRAGVINDVMGIAQIAAGGISLAMGNPMGAMFIASGASQVAM